MKRIKRAVWLVVCFILFGSSSKAGMGRLPSNSGIHILAAQGNPSESHRDNRDTFQSISTPTASNSSALNILPGITNKLKRVHRRNSWLWIAFGLFAFTGAFLWQRWRLSEVRVELEEW